MGIRERLSDIDGRTAPVLLPAPAVAYLLAIPVGVALIVLAAVQHIWF